LYLARTNFAIRADRLRPAIRQCWGLGKWLFAGQITVSVQAYVTYWLLAFIVGTTATGVYAACMSVVLFANPLIMGLGNILAPKAALARQEGGGARLRREIMRDALLLGAAMTLFCAVVLFAGEDVMHLLYRGKEYEGNGQTVTVLALALLASAVGMPASNALACMERPSAIVWVGLIAALLTVVLVWWLVVGWGLLGAAYGFLAGNVAGAVGRWVAFLTLVPPGDPEPDQEAHPMTTGSDSSSAPLIRVLQQFTQSAEDRDWVVERLDEGGQAHVFAVRSRDRQPVWQTHRSLVIKLYKPAATPSVELVRAQFDALSWVHTALNGRSVNGWKISTPLPLYVCKSPAALVMTWVPGGKLTALLEIGDNVTPEVLESIPRAVVAAMQTCWSIGQLHGDLNLDNILCDVAARDLSFVDLGVAANFGFLDDVDERWCPASHDLAYMLYATQVRLKRNIGHPGARLRKQMFTESVLRAFIETTGPFEDKQRLLDEIQAFTRLHLKGLDLSWSPRGLWHVLLRRVASRRIDAILGRLKAELDPVDRAA